MQNDDDSPDTDKSLPPDRTVISGAGTDDGPERTRIVTNAPAGDGAARGDADDDDIWGPPPDAEAEGDAAPDPVAADDDRTHIMAPLPQTPEAPAKDDPAPEVTAPPQVARPSATQIPEAETEVPEDTPPALSLPPAGLDPDADLEDAPAPGADTSLPPVVPLPGVAAVAALATPPSADESAKAAEAAKPAPGLKSPPAAPAPRDDATEIAEPPAVQDPPEALKAPPSDVPPPADDDIAAPPEDEEIAAAEDPPAKTPPEKVRDKGAVPIGTLINNNYEIKEQISAGGMGEVFRGENVFTGDQVAIKIVLHSLAEDTKIAALFMREAKVLCGLSHQAIVRYFNFVKDAELDRFCLIMEFISGQSLMDHVRDVAPLTEDEGKGLLRRLASGLEKAHEMEVVHRDLSPDNVMLRDGKVSDAVLIDFGIAKSQEMTEHSLFGQLAGKFKYISPEQLGHFGGEIGPRTDIYGLALLMAAALRGEPIDMGGSVVEAVNARKQIPDLDGVPDSFRPLLSHMLEPDPADRPARMKDVIRLLDFPHEIPQKYGAPARPDEQTSPPAGGHPGLVQTPGFRPPPGSGQQTAPGFVPGGAEGSASPFGSGLTASPVSMVPGLTTPPGTNAPAGATAPPPPRRRRRDEGGGVLRWIVVLLLIVALGGYVGWRQGLIPAEILAALGLEAPAGGGDALPDEVADTPQGPMTRASFLATFDAGPCAFATRIAAGRDSGIIETYADDAADWSGLGDAFETAFETRPTIRDRVVPETQCAALAMARSLQARDGNPPILTLDSDEMQSGGSVVGRLSDRRGRPVWLVLITNAGGVYNLTDRLTEQGDGSATFSFGLNADGSGQPQPQLILAVASDSPLIAAAAANNGARASDLLPLIEAEIAGRNGEAGAALGYFELLP